MFLKRSGNSWRIRWRQLWGPRRARARAPRAAPPPRPPKPRPARGTLRGIRAAEKSFAERFGWRGTEPFELFRSEFGQNSVRILSE